MSIHTTARGDSPPSLHRIILDHPLVAFFILAYAGTWLVLLPLLLARNGLGLLAFSLPMVPFLVVAIYAGPTLAAFILTAIIGGKAEARALLRHYVRWRVDLRWYLFALLVPPMLVTAGASVFRGVAALEPITSEGLMFVPLYLINMLVLGIVGGPLAENVGWRGFALPRLQQRYGAVGGSLILGILWALWHLPLFFITGANTWTGNTLEYVVMGIALAVIFTWFYNNTRGSLLLVVLLHAAIDASTRLLLPFIPGLSRSEGNHAVVIAFGLTALALILATRGRLSYQTRDASRAL